MSATRTAIERVVARATGQHVVAAVAGQRVIVIVAGAVDRRGAGERQVLHVRTQRVAHAALHGVGAFVQVLGHHVAHIVHHVGVVACTTKHRVATRSTRQHVIVGIAREHVIERIAGAVDCRGAGEREILHVRTQRVGDTALYDVGTFVYVLGYHVTRIVHHVGVVACTANHRVRACKAVERVVAGCTNQSIIAGGAKYGLPVSGGSLPLWHYCSRFQPYLARRCSWHSRVLVCPLLLR